VVGAINWDLNLFVERFPQSGEEVVVERVTRVPGGKGANVAVAAARLLGPNQAAIIGGLGNDTIGKQHVEIFEREGVLTSGLKFVTSAESGQAYIVIDQRGENMIHTHRGANSVILPDDLGDSERRELIAQAKIVTIMDPPFGTAVKLAEEAKRFGRTVTYDPGVRSQLGIEGLRPILKYADYIIPNESEIRNLTGTSNADLAAAKLRNENSQLKVVTKLGPRGCVMYGARERTQCDALDLHSIGMKAINTVGCGDAFLGAFVAALSDGLSDTEALRWGSCGAGLKATRPETRGSPDRSTLLRYLGQVRVRNAAS